MAEILSAPIDIITEPRDCAVRISWAEAEHADGYTLRIFKAEQPDICIKKRTARGLSKHILGLQNGTEYLVSISSFRYVSGKAQESDSSEKISFTPISRALKAQRVMCISTGELANIRWEKDNTIPMAHFSSDNEAVAKVNNGGMVEGISEGTANITVYSKGETFNVKVVVDRKQPAANAKAVLMLAGDIMCGAPHQRECVRKMFDFHDCFNGVRDILSSADLSVGVLEAACYDGDPYEYEQPRLDSGAPNTNAPSTFISAVADAGFDMISTAADRSSFSGYKGFSATVERIKALGMENLGTMGGNPIFRKVNGFRIAFIALSMLSNGLENCSELTKETAGCYSREYFKKLVALSKKSGAEYIVAYIHWGKTNASSIQSAQDEEAQFMADCGADLIVGSHPHVIQEFRYLTASDGRRVPCAFSLGNILSAQAALEENRDGIILRTELIRRENKIDTYISYVPCCSVDTDYGVAVQVVSPAFSEEASEALARIKKHVGKAIDTSPRKPLIALSGSIILDRIFNAGKRFRMDKTALLLSQISSEYGSAVPADGISGVLKLDMEKSLKQHLETCGADYLAVDFCTAASIPCYKRGDALYTATRRFLESDFYTSAKKDFRLIKPPYDEKLWKPCIERYAKTVLSVFPRGKVILFRQHFPDKYAEESELRITAERRSLNEQIREMEEYFISLVNPAVVNISGYYFSVGSLPSDFEQEYFTDACRAAEAIVFKERRCVSYPDTELWFDRVMKYYDSMTARAFQRWILDMRCAADVLIAYTNRSFAARHRDRLIKLKHCGDSQLDEVESYFTDDKNSEEIVNAARIIHAVLQGDISKPYDFYATAFKEKYNILKIMAKLLSMEVQAPVSTESAEMVFLLRHDPAKLKLYLKRISAVTVDIWGSDVSKDILTHTGKAHVGKYIFKQCPVLSYEALIPMDVPQDVSKFSGNMWRMRTISDAFMRNGMFTLSQSGSGWLVIDFFDTVCPMNEFMGGLFEVDEFIENTDFYKDIKDNCTPCHLFEKRNMEYCRNALSRFAVDMSERYGDHIILIKTDLKDKYITLNNRLAPMEQDPLFALKKRFIALCEDLFIQFTGCYVIDISKHYYSSDSYPRGGAGIVNYEDEFYRVAADYLIKIINGDKTHKFDKPDMDYIALRNLRLERK